MKKFFWLLLVTISLSYSCTDFEYNKLVDKGERQYSGKDYHGAIETYNKAIGINPNHPVAYYLRGDARKKLSEEKLEGSASNYIKDYNMSISDYNESIELRKGAFSDYNKSIELYKSNPKVFYKRGLLRQGIHDYYGARKDFTKAIELSPASSEYYCSRALLSLRIAYFEKERKFNKKTYSLHSNKFKKEIDDAISKLSHNQNNQKRLDISLKEYDEQLKTESGLLEHLKTEVETGIGIIQESYVQALKDLNKTIELKPKEKTYYYYRGIVKMNLKDYYSALSDFKMALELKKDDSRIQDSDIYYEIGLTKVQANNMKEGCRYFRIAVKKGHWDPSVIIRYCKNSK